MYGQKSIPWKIKSPGDHSASLYLIFGESHEGEEHDTSDKANQKL